MLKRIGIYSWLISRIEDNLQECDKFQIFGNDNNKKIAFTKAL
jgi:hypothetical protein